jgi:hypothetical protein
VLYAARELSGRSGQPLPESVLASPPFRRLDLDAPACADILTSSAEDIASLRAALID